MIRALQMLGCAAAIFSAFAAVTGTAGAKAVRPMVEAIELDGNASISSATLLGLMDTHVDRPFDRARLEADIRKIDGYYDSHGFGGQVPTHVLAANFDPSTGALALHIREGLTVRRVLVDYDPVIPRALVLEALATHSDAVYSEGLWEADYEGISDLFGRHDLMLGSFAGGVDVRSADPVTGLADVHYSIAPDRIGAIAIVGNVRVRDAAIRKRLGLQLGQLVTQTSLDRAQQRVARMHRFSAVEVKLAQGPDPNAPSRITLVWRVTERD